MSQKRSSNQSVFLGNLIRTAYFPATEIPPALTTKSFAQFCKNEWKKLSHLKPDILRQTTKYANYTAPRPSGGRRHLALVHPIAQLGMSLVLTENRSAIRKLLNPQTHSLYNLDEAPKLEKSFTGLDFRLRQSRVVELCSQSKFILKADISRFFYTAYTHSIPWAVLGKDVTKNLLIKDRKKLNKHWSGQIDTALQSCQHRETFGFPVGPDTSRVVAELLLYGVESDEAFSKAIYERPKCRVIDDFMIGFDTERDAQAALSTLRAALWKYNLQLNEQKTGVIRSQEIFRDQWRIEFDKIQIAQNDIGRQLNDINGLVDRALGYCSQGDHSPANFACRRLSRATYQGKSFLAALDAMIRLSRDFPSCTNHLVGFLINNQTQCTELALGRVKQWVGRNIQDNLDHDHDYELSWGLLAAGALKIKIDSNSWPKIKPNPVVFSLLGMLAKRGLLSTTINKFDWKAGFNSQSVYGEYWLPYYEAVRRKWTKDMDLIKAVTKDPILKNMLDNKVTFLEDQIFDVAHIDLADRSYKKKKANSEYMKLNAWFFDY